MSIRLMVLMMVVPGFGLSAVGQSTADSASAIQGVHEYLRDCRRDGGRLWGISLCGRLILVDGSTGFAVATAAPPLGDFRRERGLWIGRVPEGMQVANTATEWSGQRWSTVRLPLPEREFLRRRLLLHESFHRVQPALRLDVVDAINSHLDTRDGRVLLRLELNALARALASSAGPAKATVRDAALFRARRYQLFPGADTLERSLEIQEGLPEYTGSRLALASSARVTPQEVVEEAARFATRPTFVRSLGYGTGPLIGLLLDRYVPRWRQRVRTAGFTAQLWQAVGFAKPADLAAAVNQAAQRYGGNDIAKEEDVRAAEQARVLADYRARLVDGPVIILRADEMSRRFNPNNLVALGHLGTAYPDGIFEAVWGALEVTEGGALVPPSNREVRVPATTGLDSTTRQFTGSGWTLRLSDGWHLRPADRPGDWMAVHDR